MSYDVYFENGNVVTIDDRNYTSNVSPMWSKALALPEKPWVRDGEQVMGHRPNGDGTWTTSPAMNHGVRLLHDAPASECAGILAAAVERMTSNPGEYRAMNPDNGWGCYEGALEFLRWMAEMAAAHPRSVIRVSS